MAPKLFMKDVVRRNIDPEENYSYGTVARLSSTFEQDLIVETLQHFGDSSLAAFGIQKLGPNQVEIADVNAKMVILNSSDVEITDRTFYLGDFCRSSIHPERGLGTVILVASKVRAADVFTHAAINEWIDSSLLMHYSAVKCGDHVIYRDWVGVVEEVLEEITVKFSEHKIECVVEVGSGAFQPGDTNNLLPLSRSKGLHCIGRPFQKVLGSTQKILAVNWFAINQMLSPDEQNQPRPNRYWSNLSELHHVRSTSNMSFTFGDHVVFRQPSEFLKSREHEFSDPPVLVVQDSRTTVKVLWPNGDTTFERGQDLEPCAEVHDDHDLWPGDICVYTGDDDDVDCPSSSSKVAIVQRADWRNRVAHVKWYNQAGKDDPETMIPLIDLDSYGPGPDNYGVLRGLSVLISSTPTGAPFPVVAKIGEAEEDFPATIDECKRDMLHLYRVRDLASRQPEKLIQNSSTINWFGEVEDLTLDGNVIVRLPDGRCVKVPLDRIVVFDDQEGLGWDESPLHTMLDSVDMDGAETDQNWDVDYDMQDWNGYEGDEDEDGGGGDGYIDDQDIEEMETVVHAPSSPSHINENNESDKNNVSIQSDIPRNSLVHPGSQPSVKEIQVGESFVDMTNGKTEFENHCPRFEILEEAPKDHHFYFESLRKPSKSFASRMQKEFHILQQSLPENILVRAYEDRIDLLRALIIGPKGTPYDDVPILLDFYMSPVSYPNEQPRAHFHSWSQGSGRINPNLYVEGKVCLSLLNTWQGELDESWIPTRSSIYQVLVSIQGLVLVREPYYLEPGYDKQRTTREGELASRNYSERAYVFSRLFIRRALEDPPISSFEKELRWLYLRPDGGRLPCIINQALTLIEKGQEAFSNNTDGQEMETTSSITPYQDENDTLLGPLSPGSAMKLKKIVGQLQEICQKAYKN